LRLLDQLLQKHWNREECESQEDSKRSVDRSSSSADISRGVCQSVSRNIFFMTKRFGVRGMKGTKLGVERYDTGETRKTDCYVHSLHADAQNFVL
jgi:hypothetical protein